MEVLVMTKIVYVAIDVSKTKNDVLFEYENGKRKKFKIFNKMEDFKQLESLLMFSKDCIIGLEPTSNYHRPIAYYFSSRGFNIRFIPSISLARTREALHNSWDKNDPKDAQVMIHMLRNGITNHYHDPVLNNINEVQELSKTHFQVSQRKTRVQHNLLTHYLPLYFPEVQKYFQASRAMWFFRLLKMFPTPSSITKYTEAEFIKLAWRPVGRKVAKENFLKDLYETAENSIGVPVPSESKAVQMYRLLLDEVISLCEKREYLEKEAHEYLQNDNQYKILRSVPGIGPIIALTIIAESGDLKRFKHHRQYLKFCGFDLSTQQSGQYRGQSKLSKRGNARLRYVFWLASTVAVRMKENTFRDKYSRCIKKDSENADLKRKALTATAIKICRVTHSLIKNNKEYRPYFDEAGPRS